MDASGGGGSREATREGFAAALAAFLIWGGMPVLYRYLGHVGPAEILAHRIAWSLPVMAALIWAFRKGPALSAALESRRDLGILLLSTALISINWFVFVMAMVNGQILSASLGYYINPLMSVLLGAAFLGERFSRAQAAAIGLAALGVLNQIVAVGVFPWIALTLATSFALYGFLRKTTHTDAITGHFVEVAMLIPLAIIFILWLERAGEGHFMTQGDPRTATLLLISGPLTVAPLVLFTLGARRLRLSTIGLLQYLAPSIQFALGVAYGEAFTWRHLVTFALIWSGLALYSADMWRRDRRLRRAARMPVPPSAAAPAARAMAAGGASERGDAGRVQNVRRAPTMPENSE
ncbi:MAG: EamA family transporter RarD [Parvularculaceae bacterium]